MSGADASGGAARGAAGLEAFLAALPKVELHVHLEGAMQPATLLALARRRRIALPADDAAGLADWFRFRDFEHFVEVYLTCSRCLCDPEDFQRLIDDFLAEQERQRIGYTEAHFTISTHLANGADGGELLDALAEAIAAAESRRGVVLRLIPDIVRNVGVGPADRTLDWALAGWKRGIVVALGLSGSEARFSCEPFRDHFREAERQGLHRVAHAGEHAGAASIRSALEVCRPERIGHGVRCLEDQALVDELRERAIPLELSPTSNVRLGVVPSLAEHPFPALRQAGLALSINSDDPALFGTSLSEEYLRLAQAFELPAGDLVELAQAAVSQSFLPPDAKQRHLALIGTANADLVLR